MQDDQARIPTEFQAAVEADMRRLVVALQPLGDALSASALRFARALQLAKAEQARRG